MTAAERIAATKWHLLTSIQMHPLTIGEGITGLRLRVCLQHSMLGFVSLQSDVRWRFVGKKWAEEEAVLDYCKGKFCPTMQAPKIAWKTKRLKRTLALLNHCQPKQLLPIVYNKRWGAYDVQDLSNAYY